MVWLFLSVLLIRAPLSLLGLVCFCYPLAWISAHFCSLLCRLWFICDFLCYAYGVIFGPNYVLFLKSSLLPPS